MSSTRVHSFTDSCICDQNYCHTGTLETAQQNKYNLFLKVSKAGTLSFQNKQQVFSPHYALYQNHVLCFIMLPFQLLFCAAVPQDPNLIFFYWIRKRLLVSSTHELCVAQRQYNRVCKKQKNILMAKRIWIPKHSGAAGLQCGNFFCWNTTSSI